MVQICIKFTSYTKVWQSEKRGIYLGMMTGILFFILWKNCYITLSISVASRIQNRENDSYSP